MEKELKEFGLSDNEVSVYLALLKTGTATANRISELTGIKRSTTYDTLKLLSEKGLIGTYAKDKVNYFEASSPNKIIDSLKERENNVRKILPELLRIQKTIPQRSKVNLYEGRKGVIAILGDILDNNNEFLFYGSRKRAMFALNQYPENFVTKRVSRKIKMTGVLAEEDRGDPTYTDPKTRKLSDFRFLKEMNETEINIFIYGDKVAFMSSSEDLVGLIIEDPNIVKQQKRMFHILWKAAKR